LAHERLRANTAFWHTGHGHFQERGAHGRPPDCNTAPHCYNV